MVIHKLKKDGLLTTTEVGKLLNLHANTVRRWSDSGILKTYRTGSRDDRRFRYEDIMSFLQVNNTSLPSQIEDEDNENDRRC